MSFDLFAAATEWRFQVDSNDTIVPIRPRLIVSTAEAAIDAAIAGVGITCVLSYQVASAFLAGQLILLLRRFEPPPIPVSFLYSGQGRLPLKLRALVDFAAPRLRAQLQRAEAASSQPASASVKKRAARNPR